MTDDSTDYPEFDKEFRGLEKQYIPFGNIKNSVFGWPYRGSISSDEETLFSLVLLLHQKKTAKFLEMIENTNMVTVGVLNMVYCGYGTVLNWIVHYYTDVRDGMRLYIACRTFGAQPQKDRYGEYPWGSLGHIGPLGISEDDESRDHPCGDERIEKDKICMLKNIPWQIDIRDMPRGVVLMRDSVDHIALQREIWNYDHPVKGSRPPDFYDYEKKRLDFDNFIRTEKYCIYRKTVSDAEKAGEEPPEYTEFL